MRVADVILKIFEKLSLRQIFLITGGFAMHLNDATALNPYFNVTCMHHEQALSYAALGYAKLSGKPAIVQTTSGCAATNCLTPLTDAWQDNVPIVFISGNTQSKNTIRYQRLYNNYITRHLSGADADIVEIVKSVTKFAEEIYDPELVIETVIRAVLMSISGRPGPVWISVPLDIQAMSIDFDDEIYQKEYTRIFNEINSFVEPQLDILDLSKFKRPLVLAGNGIKLSQTQDKFKEFIEKWNLPFVTTFLSVDVISDEHPLYQGRIGVVGERCGNFSVSNCDCLIVLGCRLAAAVVGYNPQWFAREAYKVVVDIDANEHKKESVKIDNFINSSLRNFFRKDRFTFSANSERQNWNDKCLSWKIKWLFDEPSLIEDDSKGINPYYVMRQLSQYTPLNTVFTHTAGSTVTSTWHRLEMRGTRRFLNAASAGDMGQELPGSIGAYFASKGEKICCLNGDGSFQFNIQELQTVKHHNIPMVIVILNNGGYSAIKITQGLYFKNFIGVNSDSGVSFPETSKIANAYGIKYYSATKNCDLNQELIEEVFSQNEPVILEIIICDQERHPKLSTQKLEDGSFKSQPYENMYPFLDKVELLEEMQIPML